MAAVKGKKKKAPSLSRVSFELYQATFTALFLLLFQALIDRFKKHRDTANIRFEKLVGMK